MSINRKYRWSRVFWRKVVCPICSASIGVPCHMGSLTGGEAHTPRINLAIKMGLQPTNRICGLTVPKCLKRKKQAKKPEATVSLVCSKGKHYKCYSKRCPCWCHPKA